MIVFISNGDLRPLGLKHLILCRDLSGFASGRRVKIGIKKHAPPLYSHKKNVVIAEKQSTWPEACRDNGDFTLSATILQLGLDICGCRNFNQQFT